MNAHIDPRTVFFVWCCFAVMTAALGEKVVGADPGLAAIDPAANVDRMLGKWNRPDVPGCVVGILQDGKLTYAKGFGSANIEDETANTSHTVFEIASASKSFTCVCLALLMDEGKLDPDDELRKFVPEIHDFQTPIRVRHLVQCRSGMWDFIHLMPLTGRENLPIQHPYTERDIFNVLRGQRILPIEPGTKFHYGSGDYFWLAQIIQRVSGKSLAQFARERIFEPLGMTQTHYEEDPSLVVKKRAVAYFKEGDIWHQWRVNAYSAGGGGVKTSLSDLARWENNFYSNQLPRGKYLDEFLAEGTLLGNRYVLDADAYRKLVHPHPSHSPPGQYRGLKRIQFTGGVWGMTACMARFPDQRFAVICLCNNAEISPFSKTMEIADLFLADKLQPVVTPSPEELEPSVELSDSELQEKTGAYRLTSEGRIWLVSLKDHRLQVTPPVGRAFELMPLSKTRFLPVNEPRFYASARFLFHRDSDDKPLRMTLESNERGFREVLEFQRVELVAPTPDDLSNYSGEYLSDELGVRYCFKVDADNLWLKLEGRRWEQLDPTVRDEFIPHERTLHDNRIITFLRNGDGTVSGISVGFWRIQGVHFSKLAAHPR